MPQNPAMISKCYLLDDGAQWWIAAANPDDARTVLMEHIAAGPGIAWAEHVEANCFGEEPTLEELPEDQVLRVVDSERYEYNDETGESEHPAEVKTAAEWCAEVGRGIIAASEV